MAQADDGRLIAMLAESLRCSASIVAPYLDHVSLPAMMVASNGRFQAHPMRRPAGDKRMIANANSVKHGQATIALRRETIEIDHRAGCGLPRRRSAMHADAMDRLTEHAARRRDRRVPLLTERFHSTKSVSSGTGTTMITSDELRNLRAGPVIGAGRMNDATIRGLIAEHGLKLGDREGRGAGNPRYDLADCARVFLLHILIKKLRMRSEPAVWAVNKAYDHLAMIAEGELAAIDSGAAPDCPRYELRLPAMSLDAEMNPEIRLFSDPDAVADRESNRGRWCEILMDLREIVRAARDQLVSTLGHSTAGLRHDFIDVPAA